MNDVVGNVGDWEFIQDIFTIEKDLFRSDCQFSSSILTF